jgi:hypothetical protein
MKGGGINNIPAKFFVVENIRKHVEKNNLREVTKEHEDF